jgi:hypothetical protein
MSNNLIKFESISKEIKDEIAGYHQSRLKDDADAAMSDSVTLWMEERFDEWMFRRYNDSTGSGKRKHYRLDVEIPIKIVETLIESAVDDSSGMEIVGNVVNISRGGLYFRYDKSIELSSIIKLIIDLSGIDKELSAVEALAMVVRLDKNGAAGYGIGVVFSSIYDENRLNLDLFILKRVSNFLCYGE